jgi:uncharacterized membrane protein YjjP (DUF1212 family)
MPETGSPLTAEDLKALNENLERLDDASKIIDQATRGGIDMSEQRKQTQELRTQLLRIKQSFFPGR